MAQLSDADLLEALEDSLSIPSTEIAAKWGRIVTKANGEAWSLILGGLASRGYSASQISACDQSTALHREISLYLAFVYGGGLNKYDPSTMEKMDWTSLLKTIPITFTGAQADTTQGTSPVKSGGIATDGDIFVLGENQW